MKKRTMLKIKRMVLKTSIWVAVLTAMVTVCMLDSRSWIPTIIFVVSMLWLTVMAWANGGGKGGEK